MYTQRDDCRALIRVCLTLSWRRWSTETSW